MPGAGHPGSAQHRFHPGLVAYVERGFHIHAVKAEHLSGVGHGHLQLFQRSDEALDRAHLLAEAAYGINKLLRIEGIIHPPMPVQVLLQSRGQSVGWLGGDDSQADAGHVCGRGNKSRSCGEKEGCDESGDHQRSDTTVCALSLSKGASWSATLMLSPRRESSRAQ